MELPNPLKGPWCASIKADRRAEGTLSLSPLLGDGVGPIHQ